MGYFHRETLIERLARESRWRVAEREGDHYRICQDDGAPLRYINVRCRDDKPFVVFWINFPVRFPLSAISPELTLGLLRRNQSAYYGQWYIDVVGSCELLLGLHHSAIKAGLTAGTFQAICLEMVGEREALHDTLLDQVAGLQRGMLPPARPVIRHNAGGHQSLPYEQGKGITWLEG